MREQLRGIMTDIETIAREAKMVAFNARIVAARSGQAGRSFRWWPGCCPTSPARSITGQEA
jgi:hypothetical protein